MPILRLFLDHAIALPVDMLENIRDAQRHALHLTEQTIARKRKMVAHALDMRRHRRRQKTLAQMIAQYLYDGHPQWRVAQIVSQQTELSTDQVMTLIPKARQEIDKLNRARRDRFIMQQMRRGMTNAEIAAATGLSVSQVKRIISRNRRES